MFCALWAILVLFACAAQPSRADNTQSPLKALRIGYPRNLDVDVDRRDARAAMEIWVKTMAKNLNKSYRPEYVEFDSFEDMVRIVKEKRAEMIGMSGLDFIRIRHLLLLEPALVSPLGGKTTEQFVLLVRRDKGIRGPSQLKGRSLLVEAGGKKESGLLWLDTLLMRKELPVSSLFFSSIKEVAKASQAVYPVFFDQADACLVAARSYDMIGELNPQIDAELMVFDRSPELLRHIICFRVDYDPVIKMDLKETLLKIHELVEGRQMLTLLKTDRIVPYDPASIHPLEKLLEEYGRLRKNLHNQRKPG